MIRVLAELAASDWHGQQKPEELAAFGQLIVRERWHNVIEVGTYSGGTARYLAALGLFVTAVDRDLSHVEPHNRVPRVRYLEGDSVALAPLFPDASVDLVFVDADHSLDAVTRDWTAYWPKVRPGGALAFHDVREHLGDWGGLSHVKELWDRLKESDLRTEEFIYGEENRAGIGVAFKP